MWVVENSPSELRSQTVDRLEGNWYIFFCIFLFGRISKIRPNPLSVLDQLPNNSFSRIGGHSISFCNWCCCAGSTSYLPNTALRADFPRFCSCSNWRFSFAIHDFTVTHHSVHKMYISECNNKTRFLTTTATLSVY